MISSLYVPDTHWFEDSSPDDILDALEFRALNSSVSCYPFLEALFRARPDMRNYCVSLLMRLSVLMLEESVDSAADVLSANLVLRAITEMERIIANEAWWNDITAAYRRNHVTETAADQGRDDPDREGQARPAEEADHDQSTERSR